MVTKKLPKGFVLDYEPFLRIATNIYEFTKEDKLFDIEGKELKKMDFSKGLFLGMKLDDRKFIGVKIGIGSKEEVEEIFKDHEI